MAYSTFLWILNPTLCFSGISFLLLCLFSSIPWASLLDNSYHHSGLLGACLTMEVKILFWWRNLWRHHLKQGQCDPGVDLSSQVCFVRLRAYYCEWVYLGPMTIPRSSVFITTGIFIFFTFLLSRGYSFPTITFISACLTSIVTGEKQSQQIPEQLLRT